MESNYLAESNVLLYLHRNLVSMEVFEPLFLLLFLSHADPGVSDQDIAVTGSLHGVRGQNELGTMLRQDVILFININPGRILETRRH